MPTRPITILIIVIIGLSVVILLVDLAINALFSSARPGITSYNEFRTPSRGSRPIGIACTDHDILWFTESGTDKIGERLPNGRIIEYRLRTPNADPEWLILSYKFVEQIAWFTESHGNRIGRIDARGNIKEYPVPTVGSRPLGIVGDDNGGAWFTESVGNKIGHISYSGSVREYSIPTKASDPTGIAIPFGGNYPWFVESASNKLGELTASGAIVEHTLPHPQSEPYQIVSAGYTPDSPAWFTELDGHRLGRLDPSGHIDEFDVGGSPFAVAVGGFTIWYSDGRSPAVGGFMFSGAIDRPEFVGRFKVGSRGKIAGINFCGPSQGMWATEPDADSIVQIDASEPSYP